LGRGPEKGQKRANGKNKKEYLEKGKNFQVGLRKTGPRDGVGQWTIWMVKEVYREEKGREEG